MLQGKGIYLWQLPRCEEGDMAKVVQRAVHAKLTHLMPKIVDGVEEYERNSPYLKKLVTLSHQAGIKVVPWAFLYGNDPHGEARAAINELNKYDYDGFVINAEGYYKHKHAQATTYMRLLRETFPDMFMALSSYRFPSLHRTFPFKEFLEHVDANMPQVYWIHTDGTVPGQLDQTEAEYLYLTSDLPECPIIPTGAAFEEHGWVAKSEDVRTFIEEVSRREFSACNFWEYWHAFNRHPHLGEMIARTNLNGEDSNEMNKLFSVRVKSTIHSLTIRKSPGIKGEAVGWLTRGAVADVYEIDNATGWYRIGVSRWISGHSSYTERIEQDQDYDSEPLTSLYYPCDERWPISQRFGENPQWYSTSGGHNGIDFAIPVGNPIYAAADGEVIVAREETTGYGRHIRIRHSHGVTIYGHMSRNDVKVGDRVKAKQVIGLSGGATSDPYSGMSTGPHLHFEYRLDIDALRVPGSYVYNAVDPLPLLKSHDDAEAIFRAKCIVDSLRVRILPSTDASSTIIGGLVRGQVVNVYEVSDNGWYRIGVGRWVSGHEKFMERIEVEQPEPEPEPEPEPCENCCECVKKIEQRVKKLEEQVEQLL